MSYRYTETDYWRAQKRSAEGYVEVKPDLRKRGQHKSKYWFHAACYCRSLEVPEPVGEYYFHRDREWRLDLAWPEQKLALEVDGIWTTNAHTGQLQVIRNMEKQNAAVCLGWRVLRCQEKDIPQTIMLIANTFLR